MGRDGRKRGALRDPVIGMREGNVLQGGMPALVAIVVQQAPTEFEDSACERSGARGSRRHPSTVQYFSSRRRAPLTHLLLGDASPSLVFLSFCKQMFASVGKPAHVIFRFQRCPLRLQPRSARITSLSVPFLSVAGKVCAV